MWRTSRSHEIQNCCKNSPYQKIRLKVTYGALSEQFAISSPRFELLNASWRIVLIKDNAMFSNRPCLKATLICSPKQHAWRCSALISFKIINNVEEVREQNSAQQFNFPYSERSIELIELDELFKFSAENCNPEQSFRLEVTMTLEQPKSLEAMPIRQEQSDQPTLECPICFECFVGRRILSTPCGHLFCAECLNRTIKIRAKCPECNQIINPLQLQQIFLVN